MTDVDRSENGPPQNLRRAQTFYGSVWDEPNLLSLGMSHKPSPRVCAETVEMAVVYAATGRY